jgi:hypothetical protein
MPNYIVLGTAGTPSTWRLPADISLEEVRADVDRCMADGDSMDVPVEMQDDPRTRGTLVLNGHALPFAVLVELPEGVGPPLGST